MLIYVSIEGLNTHALSFPPNLCLRLTEYVTPQLQAQRTNRIRPGKVTKIFLSHAHGDHTFGLPGLLCLMGQDRDRDSPPVDIYGPQGLRMWLRVAIRYSVSRIIPPYRVHEIMDIPMAPEWRISKHSNRFYNSLRSNPKEGWTKQGLAGEDPESWISNANRMPLAPSTKFGEIPGGRCVQRIETKAPLLMIVDDYKC